MKNFFLAGLLLLSMHSFAQDFPNRKINNKPIAHAKETEPTEGHIYVVSQLMIKHYVAGNIKFPGSPAFCANNQGVCVTRGSVFINGRETTFICRMNWKGGEWHDAKSWDLKVIMIGDSIVYPKP